MLQSYHSCCEQVILKENLSLSTHTHETQQLHAKESDPISPYCNDNEQTGENKENKPPSARSMFASKEWA